MKTCYFVTNMIQTFYDTDLTFCVMIPKEQGFFLRAKKIADTGVSLRSAMSTDFLHKFNTCLN